MLSADATYSTTSVVEPRSLKSSRMSRFDKEDFPRRRITQAMTFVLSLYARILLTSDKLAFASRTPSTRAKSSFSAMIVPFMKDFHGLLVVEVSSGPQCTTPKRV